MPNDGSSRCHRSENASEFFNLVSNIVQVLIDFDMLFFDALLGTVVSSGARNQTEMISVPNGLFQNDALSSGSPHRPIPCGWPEPEDSSELIVEVENLQRECRELRGQLERSERDARKARKSQIRSSEQLSRQGELLEEAERATETALNENRELVHKLAQLQRWTDCLDDGEAARTMCKLYQNLQNWIRRHFTNMSSETSVEHVGPDASCKGASDQLSDRVYLDRISEISINISWHIFNPILTRFMIGSNDNFGQHLYQLDKHINETCKLPAAF